MKTECWADVKKTECWADVTKTECCADVKKTECWADVKKTECWAHVKKTECWADVNYIKIVFTIIDNILKYKNKSCIFILDPNWSELLKHYISETPSK